MGGHGGLNILPQKRWHLYRHDNRLRVQRDETRDRERQTATRQAEEQKSMSDILTLLKRRKVEAADKARARSPGGAEEESRDRTAGERHEPRRLYEKVHSDDALASSASLSLAAAESSNDFSVAGQATVSSRSQTSSVSAHSSSSSFVSAFSGSPSLASASPSRLSARSTGVEEVRGTCLPLGVIAAVRRRGDSLHQSSTPADSEPFLDAFFPREEGFLAGEDCMADEPSASSLETDAFFSQRTAAIVRIRAASSAVSSSSVCSSSSSSASSFESHGSSVPSSACVAKGVSASSWQVGAAQAGGRRGAPRPGHLNFFSAEEKELHKLEEQRRKYLQQAGHTEDAQSDFDRVVRQAVHATPWYHCPPSSVSEKAATVTHVSSRETLKQLRLQEAREAAARVLDRRSRRLESVTLQGTFPDSLEPATEDDAQARGPEDDARSETAGEKLKALKRQRKLERKREQEREKAWTRKLRREKKEKRREKRKRRARVEREHKEGGRVCVVVSEDEAPVLSISSVSEDEERRQGKETDEDECVCLFEAPPQEEAVRRENQQTDALLLLSAESSSESEAAAEGHADRSQGGNEEGAPDAG
ncbi:hypothetical protein TGCAST_297770 [Toxoplasma gondii CAST]|uniref:CBF1-interacting co-repressor CIR N-terminal domain-containing protein n=1 Tax=Toxoplasma gondii CAST TaxID=943122 RepID=A0A3R7YJT2_TOXGO|nr:hypothetical protein TGCAST_297770 [Toxoplasma gondii CAST]